MKIQTHPISRNEICTISAFGQKHSLMECHNENNYKEAKYLFSLFDEKCENIDDQIVEFSNKNPDFELHCYICDVFEATVDAFMLSVIFGLPTVVKRLIKSNEHKLDKNYPYGLGLTSTPRELLKLLEITVEQEEVI